MTDATLSFTAVPTYEGTNRLILGIVLAVRHIDRRSPEDVHYLLACGQEIVGDDPAVAAPPDRFGAHDSAPLGQRSVLGAAPGR